MSAVESAPVVPVTIATEILNPVVVELESAVDAPTPVEKDVEAAVAPVVAPVLKRSPFSDLKNKIFPAKVSYDLSLWTLSFDSSHSQPQRQF